MKRIIAVLLAVLMLASVLVACNKQNGGPSSGAQGDIFQGEDNVTLEVWAPEAAVQLTQSLCDDFIKEHSDKKISITVKPQEEGNVAAQILNDPSVAGDVFSFVCDQMNKLDKAKVLDPVPSSKDNLGFDYESEIKERDSEASIEAGTLKGELLAYPETGENGYYLVYDKSVVSDEDAKTFEGLLPVIVIEQGGSVGRFLRPVTEHGMKRIEAQTVTSSTGFIRLKILIIIYHSIAGLQRTF